MLRFADPLGLNEHGTPFKVTYTPVTYGKKCRTLLIINTPQRVVSGVNMFHWNFILEKRGAKSNSAMPKPIVCDVLYYVDL